MLRAENGRDAGGRRRKWVAERREMDKEADYCIHRHSVSPIVDRGRGGLAAVTGKTNCR